MDRKKKKQQNQLLLTQTYIKRFKGTLSITDGMMYNFGKRNFMKISYTFKSHINMLFPN